MLKYNSQPCCRENVFSCDEHIKKVIIKITSRHAYLYVLQTIALIVRFYVKQPLEVQIYYAKFQVFNKFPSSRFYLGLFLLFD